MKIAVIGSGVVGQATGKGLAKHDNAITFVDTDKKTVETLKEQGFDAVLAKDYSKVNTDITMLCVSVKVTSKGIDPKDFNEAVQALAVRLKDHNKYHLIVIRTTVPPKTTREIVIPLIENLTKKKAGQDFGVVVQPDYLRTATAEQDFARPWFILLGEFDKKSGDTLEKIYRKFDAPIERVGIEEAEFQKYAHNAYNATKIVFFNEIRTIADKEGWDGDAVLQAVAESAEGMWNPLYGLRSSGPFEGTGLVNDTNTLLGWSKERGYDLQVIGSVVAANAKHRTTVSKINSKKTK